MLTAPNFNSAGTPYSRIAAESLQNSSMKFQNQRWAQLKGIIWLGEVFNCFYDFIELLQCIARFEGCNGLRIVRKRLFKGPAMALFFISQGSLVPLLPGKLFGLSIHFGTRDHRIFDVSIAVGEAPTLFFLFSRSKSYSRSSDNQLFEILRHNVLTFCNFDKLTHLSWI